MCKEVSFEEFVALLPPSEKPPARPGRYRFGNSGIIDVPGQAREPSERPPSVGERGIVETLPSPREPSEEPPPSGSGMFRLRNDGSMVEIPRQARRPVSEMTPLEQELYVLDRVSLAGQASGTLGVVEADVLSMRDLAAPEQLDELESYLAIIIDRAQAIRAKLRR